MADLVAKNPTSRAKLVRVVGSYVSISPGGSVEIDSSTLPEEAKAVAEAAGVLFEEKKKPTPAKSSKPAAKGSS